MYSSFPLVRLKVPWLHLFTSNKALLGGGGVEVKKVLPPGFLLFLRDVFKST